MDCSIDGSISAVCERTDHVSDQQMTVTSTWTDLVTQTVIITEGADILSNDAAVPQVSAQLKLAIAGAAAVMAIVAAL